MACTADSLCPSKSGRLAKPDARASGLLHPRQATCVRFPPLWGNRLTSDSPVKERRKEDRGVSPREPTGRSGGQSLALERLRIVEKRHICQRPGSFGSGAPAPLPVLRNRGR